MIEHLLHKEHELPLDYRKIRDALEDDSFKDTFRDISPKVTFFAPGETHVEDKDGVTLHVYSDVYGNWGTPKLFFPETLVGRAIDTIPWTQGSRDGVFPGYPLEELEYRENWRVLAIGQGVAWANELMGVLIAGEVKGD